MKLPNYLRNLTFHKQKYGENEGKGSESFSPFFRQNLAALGPLLLTMVVGMTLGYSAVLIPQLQSPTNGTNLIIRITTEEASWVASMAVLPMVSGTLIGGFLIQKYGRKQTHIITCLPYSLGWLLMYFAVNLEMLLTGRFLTGLNSGVLAAATGVYIGETSEPKYRGVLLGGIQFCISAGLLITHLLGTFFSWQTTALITSVIPIIGWILMTFTPESPAWLVQKGLTEKAEKSFFWLRQSSEESKQELEMMLAQHKEGNKNLEERTLRDLFRELLAPEFWKPMGVLVVFFITTQWSGVNAVSFYSVTLMKKTLGSQINEYLATFLVDCIRLFASIVSCILLKKIDKRTVAIIGGTGTFIPLFTLSAFNYFSKSYLSITSPLIVIVPMVSLVLYVFFVTAGFVTLPWNLQGELLPLSKRSTGSGIASCIACLSLFTVVKTMPEMFVKLGVDGTFLVYGCMAFVGTVFIYFCLPETKGKTLHEIEEYFKRGNRKSDQSGKDPS